MKILFASSSSGSRGGGETFLVYLGGALAQRGHEVILWTSMHSRMDEVAVRFGRFGKVVRAEYTNTYDRPRRSLGALLDRAAPPRVAAEWRALAPDILHINKQNLEDGLDLIHAARRLNVPIVCTIHITQTAAFLGAKGGKIRDWVSRIGLRGYGGTFVTVAEPRKTELDSFLGNAARVEAIPNGVPIPKPLTAEERTGRRSALELGPEDLVILAAGRMTEQKRPFVFLEMAARILPQVPKAQFLWAGDGPLAAEWDTRVEQAGMAGKVRRLGWCEDMPGLLGSSDLLLHTAEYEGMPLAVLEAMAAGLPCAVSETLHREMPFLDESNSIRITNDLELIEILRNPAGLKMRGRAALDLAVKSFSTATMAAAYEELYTRLYTSRSPIS